MVERSNDSLYSCKGAQSYKDSQTYSRIFNVTVAKRAMNVGTFGNMFFKWPIIPYFF